jgi:hypothetical protein
MKTIMKKVVGLSREGKCWTESEFRAKAFSFYYSPAATWSRNFSRSRGKYTHAISFCWNKESL